ncbi:MAG TPA: DUF3830 family protein [Chitinophagaceae bacterium]|nr:DUF3830 family protein [Chitinophagaceae bacterium]
MDLPCFAQTLQHGDDILKTIASVKGFKIITRDKVEIHFKYDLESAPVTCDAFEKILPFTRKFFHARISGEEIWISDVPQLDIIQENASVFIRPGEAVFGPLKPRRVKTANCFGIYYGAGRGFDAANIFARVVKEDLHKLIDLGIKIWNNGSEEITVSRISDSQ